MSEASLLKIKLQNKAREQQEKLLQDRKRGLLVLISRYLLDNGYLDSSEKLQAETGISLRKFDAADNIDLNNILIDYEDYYQMKFGKKPKFFRKLTNEGDELDKPSPKSTGSNNNSNSSTKPKATSKITNPTHSQPSKSSSNTTTNTNTNNTNTVNKNVSPNTTTTPTTNNNDDVEHISGKKINGLQSKAITSNNKKRDAITKEQKEQKEEEEETEDFFENRILKPLPEDMFFGDLRELAESIRREIIVANPKVRWDDIAGLSTAKQLVKEAVVMPLKYPQLFTGILSPWRGVLLFGPPGTGKTMLAKAVATECKTTFFNISASSIVSKWRGDSEKLVRVLFQLARHYAPSTIFLDELDSIMSQRVASTEHEGSRRMKTELLIQMDGLAKTNELVFVLAASNLPWDLDQAVLRRLEKRILVGLPEKESRRLIFKHCLQDRSTLGENEYETLAQQTEGYSGSDITLTCKESAMIPMRKIFKRLEKIETSGNVTENLSKSVDQIKIDKVTIEDVNQALSVTKPSGNAYADQYDKWQLKFGI
ncbi:hypothetical protein ABK040_003565 [Willaertia magna]